MKRKSTDIETPARAGSGSARASWYGVTSLVATLSLTSIGQPAMAQEMVAQAEAVATFDIPAQSLSQALTAFGRQSGYQVSVDDAALTKIHTQGVSGTMVPQEALDRLLAGTGMAWRISGERTVVLERLASSGNEALAPLIVEERAESAYGPVEGYLAPQAATATKTDTPIIDLPGSVQVVPREVIEDQGALNLKDVYENVSSVQQAGNTLNAQSEVLPIIRGFESPTLLRNGLRSTQVGAVDLVNVERVEVLKGPASILYGALEPGGIINYVTKKPQPVASYSIGQQIGSEDFFRTATDITGPLTEDRSLLYRFNAAYTNTDSFRHDIELERVAVAPSISWAPTDDTDFLVDLSYLHEEQPYDTGVPLGLDGEPLASRDTFFGDSDLDGRTIDDYVASYELSHAFNDVWSLRNQFQFHRSEADNEALRPRGVSADDSLLLLRYQNEEREDDEYQFVLDGTAKFDTGFMEHTLLLGSELSLQESDFRRFRQNVAAVPISNDPDVSLDPPDNQVQQVQLGETRWAGFYVQDQIALLDGQLQLLLGGRYDIVEQQFQSDGVSSPDVNDEAFTGRAGLLYQMDGQYSTYVSVSQSFSPQSPGTVDADNTPLSPERGVQYEAGVKAMFFDDQLMATASVFQIDKRDVALVDQDLFNATGQIAYFPGIEQRSRGVEFDLSGALTDELQIIANYSYTETEVLANPGDPESVGDSLGGVPKHKARLWLNYHFDEGSGLDGFGLGAGVRYTGDSTAQFDNTLKLDSYVVVDAAAWYNWKGAKIGLNLYNLFDEDYIVRASDRSIAHPGQPFTVVGSASLRF